MERLLIFKALIQTSNILYHETVFCRNSSENTCELLFWREFYCE